MGACNVLFHFDKLSKRLGPLCHRFSADYDASISTPTPLFISSTLALIWMGLVLGFITFHEMTLGNKGNSELTGYSLGHLIFGCFIPLVYAFMINSGFWWSRRVTAPLYALFTIFYMQIVSGQVWPVELRGVVIFLLIFFWFSMSGYMLFSNNAKAYYDSLANDEKW